MSKPLPINQRRVQIIKVLVGKQQSLTILGLEDFSAEEMIEIRDFIAAIAEDVMYHRKQLMQELKQKAAK